MSFLQCLALAALLNNPFHLIGQPSEAAVRNAADSMDTARLVGVFSELDRLRQLSTGSTTDRWEILWLHQQIIERVLAASLQVDATVAQIDNEISRANEIRSFLADRRDRNVNRANLLSVIVGGGLGAASSGLQLSSKLSKPSAGLGIGAGTLSASLAVAGIRAQRGRSSAFDFESNMLAQFFNRPVLPNSHYPETVWTFLNESAPSSRTGITRKQQLMQTWIQVKRIDSSAGADKIRRLTSQPAEKLELTIDDFEDRSAMLQDVRSRISFLKRDLGALVESLPSSSTAGEATHP